MSAPHAATAETTERLPLDPFPRGWFAVAFTRELAPGQVRPLRFAGREGVLFRTESGQPALMEATCPHLGAHLGHGGVVEGEALRCPMHKFGFGPDGACALAGKGYNRPLGARSRVLHIREQDGLLLAWHGEGPPDFELPSLSGGLDRPPLERQVELRTHVQELAENLFDIAHFAGVHGYDDPAVIEPPLAEGPVIRVRSRMARSADFLGRGSRKVEVDIRFEMHGLGVFLVDSVATGGLSSRMAILATPVAAGQAELRVCVWLSRGDATLDKLLFWLPRAVRDRAMERMLLGAMMNDIAQDQAILQHKRHLPQPALGDLDAGIPALRRWARQFHRSPS